MKPACPTYLKSISKSKALAATLSDIELEVDLKDSNQEGIVSAFTANIHTTYSKLYKNSKKHEKLYRLATRMLSEVELEQEELSTKVDEANQTIGALWFENNFLAEKTKN